MEIFSKTGGARGYRVCELSVLHIRYSINFELNVSVLEKLLLSKVKSLSSGSIDTIVVMKEE